MVEVFLDANLLMSERYADLALQQRPIERKRTKAPHTHDLGYHDWGRFGRYEYLGPGTPVRKKVGAGIQPVNELDRLARLHDINYADTAGSPVKRFERALSDYSTGSGMLLQVVNPYSNLTLGDRIFGAWAGTGLLVQGVARVHPVTALPMAVIDWFFY